MEKDFEEFVNTFGLEVVLDPDSSYSQEQCMKWIQPLKNIIGILAVKAGTLIELCPCIVSIQGFGKDVLFDIISRWYDHSEITKTTIEGLVGIFNEDADKSVVMVNEYHERSIDTVNKIKELVTASKVVVNHKYGLKGTVTNKRTVFFFGNSTQEIPLEWETDERRGVFYNLINVPLKNSNAKWLMQKWSKDPAFYSSCDYKACEWYDPSFDYQGHHDAFQMSMQGTNLPPAVDVIYHERLFERYTPSEIVEILKMHLGDDGIKLSSQKIVKDMIGLFANSLFKKITERR